MVIGLPITIVLCCQYSRKQFPREYFQVSIGEEKMKIEFVNRIWVKGTGKVSVVRKLLFLCAILLLFMSLIQLLLGGAGDVNWFTGVGFPIVMLFYYRLNYNTGGYMSVQCDFRIENDGFHVYYYDVDYQDGNGTHAEHIYIPYQRVQKFQYSRELVSLRIISKPIVTWYMKENEKVTDYKAIGSIHTCILYPPMEKMEQILTYIEKNNFVSVTYMDNEG